MLDLVIIGGSAAGCNAAIYAARRKLNFAMITNNIGGEVAMSGEVGNWLGEVSINGFELAQKFAAHVKSYDVQIEEGWMVEKITPTKKYHLITAKNANGEEKNWETKTVIIATGIHPRQLRVPGEKEFDRKGVTYCSVCDGPLYRGKITVTIGSGNSALESALMMASLAKKVYLLSKYTDTPEHNGGFPRGENVLVDKLKSSPNVEIIYGAETTEIKGDKKVTGLVYRDTAGQKQTLAVDGIMVHIGMVPNSQLVDCEKDKIGQIMVNARCETSIPGVYAAGDVTNIPYKQIGVAAGQGIIASLSAIEYLNRFKE